MKQSQLLLLSLGLCGSLVCLQHPNLKQQRDIVACAIGHNVKKIKLYAGLYEKPFENIKSSKGLPLLYIPNLRKETAAIFAHNNPNIYAPHSIYLTPLHYMAMQYLKGEGNRYLGVTQVYAQELAKTEVGKKLIRNLKATVFKFGKSFSSLKLMETLNTVVPPRKKMPFGPPVAPTKNQKNQSENYSEISRFEPFCNTPPGLIPDEDWYFIGEL